MNLEMIANEKKGRPKKQRKRFLERKDEFRMQGGMAYSCRRCPRISIGVNCMQVNRSIAFADRYSRRISSIRILHIFHLSKFVYI
jgi:hypothetical protein